MNLMADAPEGYRLLHEGSIALAEVESHGIRIDLERLRRTRSAIDLKVRDMTADLMRTDVWDVWTKAYGENANLDSRSQLGDILYSKMKLGTSAYNASTKRWTTDEHALERIQHPFIKRYLAIGKLKRLSNTFLASIEREVDPDGLLHPFFGLNIPISYRGSSDHPNFQNLPNRDPRGKGIVRRVFIPRDGHVLVEIDYSQQEVRVAACYHRDPNMIDYIKDSTRDLHRDMAAELYGVPVDRVSKEMRHCGKNMFVFPQFYGDSWFNNAKELWGAVQEGMKDTEGRSVAAWLDEQGIDQLGILDPDADPDIGTFANRVRDSEYAFWHKRFPTYHQWKRDWYAEYLLKGSFKMLTGFTCRGIYERNKVINYPVQGSAFHCLLWALIRINRELKRRGMKSLIVGQIHDSIVADVLKSELSDFLALCKQIMTVELPRAWPWLIVPLEVDAAVSETNWYEMEPYPC